MQSTKPVKDPRKQRKMLYNAPAHIRHKFLGARLSNDLIASRGIKTLPVRKGDTIRIVRGDNAGFEGKVSRVDLKRYRIFVEGLTREKVDGTNIFVSVHPSKVIIRSLNLDDKWRKAIVERRQALAKEAMKEEKAKKSAPKTAKKTRAVKKVKVKEPAVEAVTEEKLPEEKPKAKPKAAPRKRAAKKKEAAPAAEAKPATRKKKAATPLAQEKPAETEAKSKAVKKTPTKRKSAASTKKEGGT